MVKLFLHGRAFAIRSLARSAGFARRIATRIHKMDPKGPRDINFIFPSSDVIRVWDNTAALRLKHSVIPVREQYDVSPVKELYRRSEVSKEEIKLWKKLLKLRKGEHVLFPFVFSGEWASLVRDAGAKVTALDFSEDISKRIKEKLNIETVRAFSQSLPFKSKTFDKVISYDPSILYAHHPFAAFPALSEMHRVTKKGGEMIFIFPVGVFPGSRLYPQRQEYVLRQYAKFAGSRVEGIILRRAGSRVGTIVQKQKHKHETVIERSKFVEYPEDLGVFRIKGMDEKKFIRVQKLSRLLKRGAIILRKRLKYRRKN